LYAGVTCECCAVLYVLVCCAWVCMACVRAVHGCVYVWVLCVYLWVCVAWVCVRVGVCCMNFFSFEFLQTTKDFDQHTSPRLRVTDN
jgi:hypothetical protein